MDNDYQGARPSRHRRRARTWLSAVGAALAVALAALWQLTPASADHGGFHVQGGQLLDANGNPFVMRGSTHPDVWYQGELASIGEMSALGANTVRVVLGSGERDWGVTTPQRLEQIIAECKAHKVICVLEVHDTTGYGEESAAASLDQAVDFWEGVYGVLEGEEAYVLVNIGNEPWGNQNTSGWSSATTAAIERMRSIGFRHTLVVDAPNWGQDWEGLMRSSAPQIAAADSLGNTVFSVHMYQVYGTASSVVDYFDAFQQMNLPLIVGEYGDEHQGEPVAWETVQSEAQARGIGWIAWSYSGNSGGAENLDQVLDFDPAQMTRWGERVFYSANGIGNTSERATVFDDDGGETTTPGEETSTPGEETTTPGGGEGDCTAAITAVNDWGSGWQGNVSITASGGAIDGWTLTWTWPGGQTIQSLWNADWSQTGSQVTAGDVGWNASIASGQTLEAFGFIADNGTATPTVTCSAA